MSQLNAKLGDTVVLRIAGHSENNGASIKAGSTVQIDNNNPVVATWPDTFDVPPDGIQTVDLPVTLLAGGSTDAHVTITDPDGVIYEGTATLTISVPEPGLVRISVDFINMNPVPTP